MADAKVERRHRLTAAELFYNNTDRPEIAMYVDTGDGAIVDFCDVQATAQALANAEQAAVERERVAERAKAVALLRKAEALHLKASQSARLKRDRAEAEISHHYIKCAADSLERGDHDAVVHSCQSCGRGFGRGEVPDEWQCECGGVVRADHVGGKGG